MSGIGACLCGRGKIGYSLHGDPMEVLTLLPEDAFTPGPGEVIVRVIASPINHIDLEQIKGQYPVQNTEYPQVAGNDGVGKVIKIGEGVTKLQKGDFVIPLVHGQGWWRLRTKVKAEELYKIPSDLNIFAACMLTSIYCTAYRLLKDFGNIQENETLLQNGANSSVGQIVTQLAKAANVRTMNIVRNRHDLEDLCEYIEGLGGDYVMTDREMLNTCVFTCDRIPKPKIAFNGIGHVNAMDLMGKVMADDSLLVAYGEASGKPLRAEIESIAYRNIKICGFWMDKWHRQHLGKPEQTEMLEELIARIKDGSLKTPQHATVKFESYKDALCLILNDEGRAGVKFILDIGELEDYEPEEEQPKEPDLECNKKNCEEEAKKLERGPSNAGENSSAGRKSGSIDKKIK